MFAFISSRSGSLSALILSGEYYRAIMALLLWILVMCKCWHITNSIKPLKYVKIKCSLISMQNLSQRNMVFQLKGVLYLTKFNPSPAEPQICHVFANSVDPNQLASALFVINYVNLYQQPGSSNLIGLKLEVSMAS